MAIMMMAISRPTMMIPIVKAFMWERYLLPSSFCFLRHSSTNHPHGGASVGDVDDADLLPARNYAQFRNCFDALAGEFAGAHGAKLADGDAGLADLHWQWLHRPRYVF